MMKMPSNAAAWLQFQLYLITIDQYSPESFATGTYALCQDPKSRWQLAVDTIYRCGVCGLMSLCNREVWQAKGINDVGVLAKVLAQYNPEDRENSLVLNYWVAPEIIGTDLCHSLSDKYDLDSYSYTPGVVCVPFIEEIEALFDRNGLSWSDAPLIELGSGAAAQS
jgi:hypothetical protein